MISTPLAQIETELRRATAQHRYADVQALVLSLCQMAAEQTRKLPARDPQILEIAGFVDALLEWTRVMLTTARAAQASQLRQAYFAKGYLGRSRSVAQVSVDL